MTRDVVAASHEAVDGILALCTAHGWALVRAMSLAPQGVLLRHADVLDRDLDCDTRMRINEALRVLSPVLGAPKREPRRGRSATSPLANVGSHLLGARVVADASAWTAADRGGSSRRQSNLEASLVLPPRGIARARTVGQLPRIDGQLTPLNDPDPSVLGVALSARAVAELRMHLRLAADPRRGRR